MNFLMPEIAYKKFFTTIIVFTALVLMAQAGFAHEPVFGIGPENIFKDGVGIELEYEAERPESNDVNDGWHTEILYGLTDRVAVTASFPVKQGGVGDVTVRGKWRFWTEDSLGAQKKLALVGGVTVPAGRRHGRGDGTRDVFGGLVAGYESVKWYAFTDVRYRDNGSAFGLSPGDVLTVDASVGLRPRPPDYYKIDTVFLLEWTWQWKDQTVRNGVTDANSGGRQVFFAPTTLISYRNYMFKGGYQIPISDGRYGTQETINRKVVAAIEYHF